VRLGPGVLPLKVLYPGFKGKRGNILSVVGGTTLRGLTFEAAGNNKTSGGEHVGPASIPAQKRQGERREKERGPEFSLKKERGERGSPVASVAGAAGATSDGEH